MLEIGGRPVIDCLLDRMEAASCAKIRVVTRLEKEDVTRHVRSRGAEVVLARPTTVSESLLAGLEGVRGETPVLFGFPDTLWGPEDGFAQLLAALGPGVDIALGIFRAQEPARSDVVALEGERITGIEVKPDEPRSSLVWGCAATFAHVLRGVAGHAEPGRYFDSCARQGAVRGVRLEDPFVDVGTPESLRRARAARLSGEVAE
jgi:NDP-sugar pyrophosphorylase family protein